MSSLKSPINLEIIIPILFLSKKDKPFHMINPSNKNNNHSNNNNYSSTHKNNNSNTSR